MTRCACGPERKKEPARESMLPWLWTNGVNPNGFNNTNYHIIIISLSYYIILCFSIVYHNLL